MFQPCPDTVEFREHQCTAFNSIPYSGALMSWIPHYDEENPCALICVSHTGVIAQLATSVRDGTRCRPGSLDMCIDGKCQVMRHAVNTCVKTAVLSIILILLLNNRFKIRDMFGKILTPKNGI